MNVPPDTVSPDTGIRFPVITISVLALPNTTIRFEFLAMPIKISNVFHTFQAKAFLSLKNLQKQVFTQTKHGNR